MLSEKGFSFDQIVIQAVATQGGFVVLHAGKCSKQNHNVARLGAAEQLSSVRIFVFAANAGGGVGQHRRDAAGNPIRFTSTQLSRLDVSLVVTTRLTREVGLGKRCEFRIRGIGIEAGEQEFNGRGGGLLLMVEGGQGFVVFDRRGKEVVHEA